MRILHTSDLHLGIQLYGTSLLEYQKIMLDSLCDIAVSEKADAVIISGDIFDRAIPSAQAVSLWSNFSAKLCGELGIKAFVIAGNHDGGVRLSSCCELLSTSGLYISGTLSDGVRCVRCGNAVIHLLPYFTADDVRAHVPDAEITSYRDAFETMLKETEDNIDEDAYNILITHCFVSGAQTSDSERSVISGGIDSLAPEMFDRFDYTAAGHLHRRQTLGKVRYSGTPLCCSFSEAAHNKTVTLIDTESGEITDIEMPQPYTLRTLHGSMDEITESGRCDDYIRAEITSGYQGYKSLELLREIFPNLMCISVEKSDTVVTELDGAFSAGSKALTPAKKLRKGYRA